jgi:hypothetical protein
MLEDAVRFVGVEAAAILAQRLFESDIYVYDDGALKDLV